MSLDSLEALKHCIEHGVYSTKLRTPQGHWLTHHEATLGDFVTMKAGDNIYFFINRKIYGIGELVNVGEDCKFSNFPGSSEPQAYSYDKTKRALLWDDGESTDFRWICTFKSAPDFFLSGVDMDDVLASNPGAFRSLRVFWRRSFIKFDDEENQAFRDAILKFNQKALTKQQRDSVFISDGYVAMHRGISEKLPLGGYDLDVKTVMSSCAAGGRLRHEMAIEVGLLYQLACGDTESVNVFGDWDYLHHQVVASPFKPIDYMDKIDVFGYSFLAGFKPTKSNYLVIEIKKDAAGRQDIDQLLKYVDWVKDEYCFSDYAQIRAFLVAQEFNQNAIEYQKEKAKRYYTVGRRPATSGIWNDLSLVRYRFDEKAKRLVFGVVS